MRSKTSQTIVRDDASAILRNYGASTHTQAPLKARTCTPAHKCMRKRAHALTRTGMHLDTLTHTHALAHTHAHTNDTHTHTHTHTHAHTHPHTH